jgi:hypothetical protein
MALTAPRSSPGTSGTRWWSPMGSCSRVVVHPANLPDRVGAKLVLGALDTAFPRLHHIWADQGDAGALGSGVVNNWA